jgi:hypothetical protein
VLACQSREGIDVISVGDSSGDLDRSKSSDEVHRALRVQAAAHGRSTEAEVRAIITDAVAPAEPLEFG